MNGKRVLVARAVGRLCLLSGLLGLLAVNPLSSSSGPLYATANGDNYTDLVVGVQYEDIGAAGDAGGVNVLYGSTNGLTATGNQFWSQDSTGMQGTAEAGDSFAFALAAGDFDGDGYVDLAVGVADEDIGGVQFAGGVNVLYGSTNGLTATGNQFWSQDSTDVLDTAEELDRFGWALAAGDFDRDGYADLAVGVPGEEISGAGGAGAVNVLYGSADGLSATRGQFWHQGNPDVWGTPEVIDNFGAALVTGDFDGDGYADLAVGVPGEAIGAVPAAGAVNIIYGSENGLSTTGAQGWSQDSTGIADVAESSDGFGRVLAAGDLDGDGYDDLIVGVPYENIDGVQNAGAVNVLYGSAAGLSASGDQFWHQDVAGVQDTAEALEKFGHALAVGDLDGDGYADLVVGVPYENLGTIEDAGAVNVFYGSADGVLPTGNQLWHQDSNGVVDTAESGDLFGWALAVSDFDLDGYADLAVGAPDETVGGVQGAGAVNVLYGSAAGLSATGDQIWHQNVTGVRGTAEDWDRFGYTLVALDPARYRLYLPLVLR